MINFTLNGIKKNYSGDENLNLLKYLREVENIISPKDGCSEQGACGTCLVEMNGKAILSCTIPMKKINNSDITTIEGFPTQLKETLGKAFVEKGAVQCGFCTPGFLMRTKILLQSNPNPTRKQIIDSLKSNICRCTGYVKIFDAIEFAAKSLRENYAISLKNNSGKVGTRHPKYFGYQTAIGQRPFLNDLKFDSMLFAALKFSLHPRARILKIDFTDAEKLDGVVKIFTAKDILGKKNFGLIYDDQPLMISEGEITRYIGDVLASVVAVSEVIARRAVSLIKINYEILEPVTDVHNAESSNIKLHEKGNLLEVCSIKRGEEVEDVFSKSEYIVHRKFQTQIIEHAYLEPECAIAVPLDDDGIKVYSQSQGVYEDRRQIAGILNLPLEKVNVILVENGGGFGGKEDMTVQGHAALQSFILKRIVKLNLTRDESIIMHPKRHPLWMDYKVSCNKEGMFTALKTTIIGDTGAYASVGTKVLERAAGHAAGAYNIPNAEIISKTIYTNNLVCGAMRGFGVNQVTFAIESCIDELCELGNFDRWQFRFNNALTNGCITSTGQMLKSGVGVQDCLLAIKDDFYIAKYSGIACGIKNTGIGNGMPDSSEVKIEIAAKDKIIIHHGWTEMGQGVHTIALQTFCEETGINPDLVEVKVDTKYAAESGMTTASRATSLVGNALIDACKELKKELQTKNIEELIGNVYKGKWICDWTTKPSSDGEIITHYSYSYAAQLVILDEQGNVDTVIAAHDAGKIMNPTLFEGQIEGAVVMGLGYALTEDLPLKNGKPISTNLIDCGLLKAKDIPKIIVKGIEVKDPLGPYGAKGVGEIGLVPTAAAVANALFQYDGIRRFKLPMKRKAKIKSSD